MAYVEVGRFTLGKNQYKQSEKQPDSTGKITIDGKEYRLSAWIQDGANGKFYSGQVSVDDSVEQTPARNKPDFGQETVADVGEIPF